MVDRSHRESRYISEDDGEVDDQITPRSHRKFDPIGSPLKTKEKRNQND